MALISLEDYDIILDALDNEDTNKILKCFQKFELDPYSFLIDAPRYGNNNNIELNTYLDYVICYNLTDIIDVFINELNLEITDDIMSRCITLYSHDTYRYFCELGYIPESNTFLTAVQYCCSTIVDSILEYDKDMVELIDEEHIENIFNCNIDEETVETIRVLFNYDIDCYLFNHIVCKLKEQNNDIEFYDNYDCDKDIILEIIDIIESNSAY
jgi:hypothetical protein